MNATRRRAKTAPSTTGGALAGATRGRARNYTQMLGLIHQAAIEVFAAEGLAGASTQAIADKAGLSKAQLHYYIESKEALYRQVLQDIVNDWIGVFGFSDEALGPRKVLTELIQRRMQFSFDHPLRSRIFTAEMMRGAPAIREMMGASRQRTEQAAAVIRNWAQRGLMDPVDPLALPLPPLGRDPVLRRPCGPGGLLSRRFHEQREGPPLSDRERDRFPAEGGRGPLTAAAPGAPDFIKSSNRVSGLTISSLPVQ